MTLADDALALAAEAFTSPDMVGIAKRACIRYVEPGPYHDGVAATGSEDLPCLAMLLRHEPGRQGSLTIEPGDETWHLQGVPRSTRQASWYLNTDPEVVASERQFEPKAGHMLVVETVGGTELFAWTGGMFLHGDLKGIVEARDPTAGTGAVWEVTARPAT